MATVADAIAALDAIKLPVTQQSWDSWEPETLPPLPYAILVPLSHREVTGSDGPVGEYREYQIQLYTKRRNVALEKGVRTALAAEGVRCPLPDVARDPNGHVTIAYFHTSLEE